MIDEISFKGVIFDLDGVVTDTAHLHFQAWKQIFDDFLRKNSLERFEEFTIEDYLKYVDGKPRYNGVESFLASRGFKLEWGDPSDEPNDNTICGIGNRKNEVFQKLLEEKGAKLYPSTVELIKDLKSKGIKIGLASSSKNCLRILESVGITDLFDARVDGVVSAQLGLRGKPEPDIFLVAAEKINVHPSCAVVVEDATSGVEAGRNAGFKLVLGVARKSNQKELFIHGADVVVEDLEYIDFEWIKIWFDKFPLHLFQVWDDKEAILRYIKKFERNNIFINPQYFLTPQELFSKRKKIALFLDYDGTLTPIVDRPEWATLSEEMRDIVKNLSERFVVAIVSGRKREEVQKLVGVEGVFYAGSHGMDIKGDRFSMIHPQVEKLVPVISQINKILVNKLGDIKGVIIENKTFSIAVHYRLVEDRFFSRIKDTVEEIVKRDSRLYMMCGKKVFEIMPNIRWDKGKAVRWLMQVLGINEEEWIVIYIGDDTTDEDAFRLLRTRGVSVLVSSIPKISSADYYLKSVDEVKVFLGGMIER